MMALFIRKTSTNGDGCTIPNLDFFEKFKKPHFHVKTTKDITKSEKLGLAFQTTSRSCGSLLS